MATRVNTRVLQLPVVSRLVMATMTTSSSLCTLKLVTPDLIAQRSLYEIHEINFNLTNLYKFKT